MAKLESKTSNNGDSTKSALSAIAAGILVIIAGFLVYNYFSKTAGESEGLIEKLQEQAEKITSGEEATQKEEEEDSTTEEAITGEVAGGEASGSIGVPSAWVANNIAPNTISGDSYSVTSGDTLWEIAEGRYGSGFEWHKILNANSNDIGFLPNGSQALIFPGQVLVLPN